MLWVRSLDSFTAQSLAGTEGAEYPFWSPDGSAIGFFAEGKLKTISATGGSPFVVAAAPLPGGGSWGRDGTILFAGEYWKGLERVPATGGNSLFVVELDLSQEGYCTTPRILPDGRHFLYRASGNHSALAGTYFGSLDGKERRLVVNDESDAAYAAGFLLYRRGETLLAQTFDPARGTLTGDPHVVADHVAANPFVGAFDVTSSGLLIYRSANEASKRLAWFDANGKNLGLTADAEDYYDLRLSPDGRELAVNFSVPAGAANSQIWIEQLARSAHTKFTTDPDSDHGIPLWSPDGSHIAFATLGGKAQSGIYLKEASGAGTEQLLLGLPKTHVRRGLIFPTSWSRDGRFILYTRGDLFFAQDDIWLLPLGGDQKPRCLVRTPVTAYDGQFSPDGLWVAYTSRESGRDEVYVVPFDSGAAMHKASAEPSAGGGAKCLISTNGGRVPRWRGDSRVVFYLSPAGQMIAAELATKGGSIEVSKTQVLFVTTVSAYSFAPYDVTADGTKFVVNKPTEEKTNFTLLANWPARLRKQ